MPVKVEPTKAQGSLASPKTSRSYMFDITKAEEIFDHLMADKLLHFSVGHKIPPRAKIKWKEYCKYHNSWNHTTVNCITFRNGIQDRIDKGDFKFPEAAKKGMAVDKDPFPYDFVANMVHVDMRGAPRTTPRQKVSLRAPSRLPKEYKCIMTLTTLLMTMLPIFGGIKRLFAFARASPTKRPIHTVVSRAANDPSRAL